MTVFWQTILLSYTISEVCGPHLCLEGPSSLLAEAVCVLVRNLHSTIYGSLVYVARPKGSAGPLLRSRI